MGTVLVPTNNLIIIIKLPVSIQPIDNSQSGEEWVLFLSTV